MKAQDWASAADLLSDGANLLLKADQGGSGGDLALMLLNDVYIKGEYECNDESKKRLIDLMNAFPPNESTRKRYINEVIGWSAKIGELERGDPDLHHAAGKLYADERDVYDAERHLLLGTKASAAVLAQMHYDWYKEDSPHLAALYASRSVLPYLTLGNLASATAAFGSFTSQLITHAPQLFTQPIDSSKHSMRVFPSLPLLNFLNLLLLSAQKGDGKLFTSLNKQYAVYLKDVQENWSEALLNIGEQWFGIKIPTAFNPMMGLMNNLMGFGGGAKPATPRSSTPKPKPVEAKKTEATSATTQSAKPAAESTTSAPTQPPPTMDLD